MRLRNKGAQQSQVVQDFFNSSDAEVGRKGISPATHLEIATISSGTMSLMWIS